ncbi:hypothetical protein PHMEG_00017453 [Phytophthora megakarya]|uniref:Uncharacterized protein n=1 Tax=Phytophthora megakarya TaxID=4795 RepID=A0A225VW98_9STRA|nr:hypothetical protein PHMEG_00017453 [Phytophthora megakarya]
MDGLFPDRGQPGTKLLRDNVKDVNWLNEKTKNCANYFRSKFTKLETCDESSIAETTSTKGLYDLPCPGRRRDAKRNITNGQFLELIQRYVLPFDIHTTEKAMWNVMRQIIFQGLTQVEKFVPHVHFHSHHVEASNSTLKTSFRAEVANLGDVKCVQFRTVVRKYIEQNRVVFICKITLEPIVQKKKVENFRIHVSNNIAPCYS